jgi:peptidyl-prolyl cis-trans isomerase A (cyclophilin A)
MKVQSLAAGVTAAVLMSAAAFAGQGATTNPKLLNPASMTETAPATYKVNLDTTKGLIVIQVHRDWAPIAADRFYNLVKNGFYDEVRFFRVIPGFMAQFGMSGNPAVTRAFSGAPMKDEPTKMGNKKGYVTFARTGAPNSRGTQMFINYGDNSRLDADGFAAFGEVTTGMDVAEKINAEYREQPNQGEITAKGNAYLQAQFPRLDYIKTAKIAQ